MDLINVNNLILVLLYLNSLKKFLYFNFFILFRKYKAK